jgi:hypothetical protein
MRTRFIEYDQESYIHEEEVIGLHVNMKNDEANSNGRRERQELVAMRILHREVKYKLISLLRGWNFKSLGSTKRYRGLYIGWNTRSIKVINSWGFKSRIGITILSLKLEDPLNIFNIYDPC